MVVITLAIAMSMATLALIAGIALPTIMSHVASAVSAVQRWRMATLDVCAQRDPNGWAGIMDFWVGNSSLVEAQTSTESLYMASRNTCILVPSAAAGWVRVGHGIWLCAKVNVAGESIGWTIGTKAGPSHRQAARVWLTEHRRSSAHEMQSLRGSLPTVPSTEEDAPLLAPTPATAM